MTIDEVGSVLLVLSWFYAFIQGMKIGYSHSYD